MEERFHFAIDRGGTFTDVFAECPNGKVRILKLLSVDPANYKDAPTEGIRRILESETGTPHLKDAPINTARIGSIRMGTTVATNALLERNGERVCFVVTKGFKDILHIGTQSRPNIFDLKITIPSVLYEDVIEVDERIFPESPLSDPVYRSSCSSLSNTTTSQNIFLERSPDLVALRSNLQKVYDSGIRAIAIALLHSYCWSFHEEQVAQLAQQIGFSQISLSSKVMPMIKIVSRGFTVCADAYLTPCIQRYVHNFCAGFDPHLLNRTQLLFMQSDGGLTPVHKFTGSRSILSGPAGGVVGFSATTYHHQTGSEFSSFHPSSPDETPPKPQAVIGFDMGGTSTDVSRYDGSFELIFESTTAGVTIQAPQLDINTVAAGGGSRLFYRSGMFVVGPESSSAHPGPLCYRKGGFLSITDANVFLGRIQPAYFPKLFGPDENQPLDYEITRKAFETLTHEINQSEAARSKKKQFTPQEVALGFLQVANETMCRPIRELTQSKGFNPSDHILACFGGAGGQHACAIASSLGMSKVHIHKYSGILSAYGLALADVISEAQEPCLEILSKDVFTSIILKFENLESQVRNDLASQGFASSQIEIEYYCNLRYEKTDCPLMIRSFQKSWKEFQKNFLLQYVREFGFTLPQRNIIIDDVRIRGIGKSRHANPTVESTVFDPPQKTTTVSCYFEGGFLPTELYLVKNLHPHHRIQGPALLLDENSTILVDPFSFALVTPRGDILISVGENPSRKALSSTPAKVEYNMIQLSIFSHRFMSIAEQMGRTLQRTAISTNIKERLDFSCALFGPDGGLVANAPHIPVHLGAMQEAVKYQIAHAQGYSDGDVFVSNHPQAGGSHLPDITVMTPVFHPSQHGASPIPVFWVASRGHHADIGGITPGSMPPNSCSLQEEGACIKSFKLVEKGQFQEEGITEILQAPQEIPGSSGTRNLQDNLSDLKAQVAANHKGIQLVNELMELFGLATVQTYMQYIQTQAEAAVREMLKSYAASKLYQNNQGLTAHDYMDDGTKIALRVTIDQGTGCAVFDFEGTGIQVLGNCNAPPAITYSAIIYCMRCLVGHDIPLNQGCLNPIQIKIPNHSILNPSETAAVVGGNVLTSQRVVDVILKAFQACAASQGCMNNLTFGNESIGYYETIAGGAGAGPSWDGRSGVHTHMTNTRITDPEILETRYPVILRQFSLRPHSGGQGEFRGGDGLIRELEFRASMTVSLLTERRSRAPYGMHGGMDGQPGENIFVASGQPPVRIPAKAILSVQPHDRIRLLTPSGGGFGRKEIRSLQSSDAAATPCELEKLQRQSGSVFEYHALQESV